MIAEKNEIPLKHARRYCQVPYCLVMLRGTVAVPCSHVLDVPQDFLQISRVCPTRPLKYTVFSSCSRSSISRRFRISIRVHSRRVIGFNNGS